MDATATEREYVEPAAPPVRRRGWFAFLGGSLAWTAHLMLAYAIAEFGCVAGVGHWSMLGVAGLAWIIIALSVICFAVAVAAAVVGYRAVRGDGGLLDAPAPGDSAGTYLARAGAVLSGLLALVIAIESVPILFFLEGC